MKRTIMPCVDASDAVESAKMYNHIGADAIGYYEPKVSLDRIKEIKAVIDVPFYVGGGINDLEDIKKVLYAGADKVCLGQTVLVDKDIVKKASNRFGKDSVVVAIDDKQTEDLLGFAQEMERLGASELLIQSDDQDKIKAIKDTIRLPIIVTTNKIPDVEPLLQKTNADSIAISDVGEFSIYGLKKSLTTAGMEVNRLESPIAFDELTTNADGMVPVVTQDYLTNEVLMVAYMTKEAFDQTIETGIMTYYSRSRQELWVKGDTSGHFQYVKELIVDCDKDTLLAKVRQVGQACHTGHYSCFFTPLIQKEYKNQNPMHVFEDVYQVIEDRKKHPKEGSYTNYLFDEGIDKILKKVGEECTEIVIAAKNPDKEEIKYEISDFLYHMMVLMAEKDMTWEEVTNELMERK